MAVRKIIPLGDPKLKKVCKPVKNIGSVKTKKLIRDLRDTMRKADLVGIAAPQIGVNFQVFLTEQRKTKARSRIQNDKLRVYINPQLVKSSKKEVIIHEGCGCTGDIFGPVKRPAIVTVQAFDENGDKFEFETDGLLGRIIQHELDHLDGIEFVLKVDDNANFVHRDYYLEHIRNSDTQAKKCKITKRNYKRL